MRQWLVRVPPGHRQAVLDAADACGPVNVASVELQQPETSQDLVLVHLSNRE